MPSEKQLAANRQNSKLSTGHRTEAGKSITRMNALKSGIHAESHTIRGEDPEELAELAAEYNSEFHPFTARQRDLVDTLVRNEWKIRRLERIETELWEGAFDCNDSLSFDPDDEDDVRRRKHPVRAAFSGIEDRLERLQRRLHAYERSTTRALRQLRELQAAEELPSETTEESPSRIGFVPSNLPNPFPAPDPRLPAPASEAIAPRPISEHFPPRAIPVTDCTETAYTVADKMPAQPTR